MPVSSRRTLRPTRLLWAGIAAILLLATAACGSSDAPAEADSTRTVQDMEGTAIAVPAHPKRVVTLSEPTLDGALALGVTPVGTVAGRGQSTVPHYLADLAGDIPVVGNIANPDYEAIAALHPDLILVDGTSINNNAEVIGILGEIAPTVQTGYAGGDWRANFALVADALNRTDQADGVVTDYEKSVAAAKKKLTGYAGQTFSIVRWQGGSASLILSELPAGIALSDLGLERPPAQDRRGRGHSEPVSLENLGLIDADQMFFGTLGGSSQSNPDAGGTSDVAGAQKALAQAEKVPGFTALKAYQDGNIHLVDGSLWTSTGGPLLMQRIVASVPETLG
ncbi:MAG: iron-siderophore ABC transporter substrate-binding protein [Nocardioidaceae bacterium]